ncbi:hypothetical protein [Sulfurisphaera ohwakuensis]|uniref:hypothetical protein n=1 Tax=Sulfurisphaera ohwakuensis TaxID=69656 RepID=UPI0036F224C3
MEGNPIARQIVESPFKLALYKFGLASLIPILILIFHIAPESMIYYDTVIEVLITWWNTLTIWRHKVGK